jgi:tetratricopeptide (TPR) repeat protein
MSSPFGGRRLRLALALLVPAAAACASAIVRQEPGLESLDWAFRFASSVETHPRDMAKAQQAVLIEYMQVDALDEAVARAERVANWRRGVVYADLAKAFVEAGRAGEARELLDKARLVEEESPEWRPRIQAHVAEALAALGDVDRSSELAEHVAGVDPIQYHGRAGAIVASALARDGRFDEAMQRLVAVEGHDIGATWSRAMGYVAIAKTPTLSAEQRAEALEAARAASETVPGWKRIEAHQIVGREFWKQGMTESSHASVAKAEELVLQAEDDNPAKAILLAKVARTWAECGNAERAVELLRSAEPIVSAALNIEQPIVLSAVAAGYSAAGQEEEARRVYGEALDLAANLVNSRPRALAVSAICRSIGTEKLELDESTRERLEALFAGLGDPW